MELFEKSQIKRKSFVRGNDIFVTVNKGYKIGFMSKLVREFELNKYTHAQLYYDNEQGLIGVQFLKEATKNSFKITKRPQCDNFLSITASSFISAYNIPLGKKVAKWDEKQKMVVAKINSEF